MTYQSELDGDFAVTQVHCVVERFPNPGWRLPSLPKAGHYVLCAALRGRVLYAFSGGEEIEAEKGDILFFTDRLCRSGRSHPQEPWHFISVTFDICAFNPQAAELLEQVPWRTKNPTPAMLSAFQELHRVWTGKHQAYMLKCRSLLEGLLFDLMRLNASPRTNAAHCERIERIRQYMQDHCEQAFSVQQLSAMANYSPSHFRMLFKQIVGLTPTQYLSMVRVYKARDYMLSGEMNVSEAAARTGYRDIFYFSRQFKAIVGQPPSRYTK